MNVLFGHWCVCDLVRSVYHDPDWESQDTKRRSAGKMP